jgi:transposase InsO family protein
MNSHNNASLTPRGREEMVRAVVDDGLTRAAAARRFNTTPKTVTKWVKRFEAEGVDGLRDRSSRPHSSPSQTAPATCAAVEALRRQRRPGKQIAAELKLSPATVSRILRRRGLNKLGTLEPVEPVRRYERAHPGELIHIDIKKLGRIDGVGHRITGDRRGQSNRRARGQGLGWEYVHVCVDDASRVAFAKVMPDEKKESAVAFLKAALAYYKSLGVPVDRVMTDNGSCYKAFAFRDACRHLGLRHIRTKPYPPKTNGKAERFIQTALREWAYAQAYPHSIRRTEELPIWLHRYNWHRPHASLKANTPISRLGLAEGNLLRLHSGATLTRSSSRPARCPAMLNPRQSSPRLTSRARGADRRYLALSVRRQVEVLALSDVFLALTVTASGSPRSCEGRPVLRAGRRACGGH